MTKEQNILHNSTLGQQTNYTNQYDPKLLYPIPRHFKRAELGIIEPLPFYGFDIWNDYETSWLNTQGKPMVAITEMHIPCTSVNIVESKSLKLYLNSLSDVPFSKAADIQTLIQKDLSAITESDVRVIIHSLDTLNTITLAPPPGICIDQLDISIDTYETAPHYLTGDHNHIVTEKLYSHLLKSNCPVTQQPDWGTLIIEYTGRKISREGLLRYIVSLRHQYEFHEQCIERIFINIMQQCQPQALTVLGRYTRRGGKDINPYRSTEQNILIRNQRLIRQ